MEYNILRRYNSTFTKYSLVSDKVILFAACCWENYRLSRFWTYFGYRLGDIFAYRG